MEGLLSAPRTPGKSKKSGVSNKAWCLASSVVSGPAGTVFAANSAYVLSKHGMVHV
jgi:hypothetical protein